MKKLLAIILATAALGFTSCDDDEVDPITEPVIEPTETETITVSGLLESDVTWTNDNIYQLSGRVIVTDGATLTIEPGTIIKGAEGNGATASVLIVARGAKIEAKGTAAEPIIFTSVLDEVTIGGEYVGNLSKISNELWGGLIILGKANVSAKSGDTEASIEGLPANEAYGKYGAATAADFEDNDNSGTLSYVSIRHGGITIGEGNEINGLTLGGVGSGTSINNIEIYSTLDDGVEFFGGSVSVTNVLVYWQGDDAIDIDQNYNGTVSNFVIAHGDGVGTDEALEIDGPESTRNDGMFTLINGTIMHDGSESGSGADLKSDAQGTLTNLVFKGFVDGEALIKVEGEYSSECEVRSKGMGTYGDALDHLLEGTLVIIDTNADGVKLYSKKDENKEAICGDISAADTEAAAAKFSSDTAAAGADTSVFGWTVAVKSGDLVL